MIGAELHINGKRVDLYDNVNIVLKDSIKQAKDVGTLFTAYTQSFKIPASKANNKIFTHYHDVKVLDGFDARRKHDAMLKVNGANFQKGYVKINSVERKNNIPESYSIQFFGGLTSLKDTLGDGLLSGLTYLNVFNHDYDLSTVQDGFETGLLFDTNTRPPSIGTGTTGQIKYPLLSHTRGFKYDTNGFYDITETSTPGSEDRLDYTDLKPAIKAREILTGIERKYGLSFGGDFIESDNFNELYLWLHKDKGEVKNGNDVDNLNYYANIKDGTGAYEYDLTSGNEIRPLYTFSTFFGDNQYYECTFDVATADSGNYQMVVVAIPSNGGSPQTYVLDEVSGNNSLDFTLFTYAIDPVVWEINTYVYADNTISSIDATVTIEKFVNSISAGTSEYSETSISLVKNIVITDNMPKMKCIDFLRGIMKMFNLVAYLERTSYLLETYDIILQPLDEYYKSGKAVNLTEYIDISESTVERITPYNLLTFKYEDPSTFLIKNANTVTDNNFGNASFNTQALGDGEDSFLFDGGEYKIEVPFEKMMYERIVNGTTDALTQIQWGWFVNDFSENTPEPEIGNPLLMYIVNRSCSTNTITWSDASVTNTTYNAPSNVSSDETQTINFDAEIDEYELATNENSLFQNYYKLYTEGIYDVNARRVIFTAYLPAAYMFNFKLNDKIIIDGTPYNIDSITINLLNGKTKLDLLRVTAYEQVYVIEAGECYSVDGYVDDGYWCDEFKLAI